MSASEKLKVLERMQEANPSVQIVEGECKRIFPQILAIVEAAEALPELGEDNYLLSDLREALGELDKALVSWEE